MHHVVRVGRLRRQQSLRAIAQNAAYSTTSSSRGSQHPQQPTKTSNDGSRTLRAREHGNRNLPLPPMMDPILTAGRQRHKTPKETELPEDTTTTAFQKALEVNPYAQALATPVRRCMLTRARLPIHFLVPFVAEMPAVASAPTNGKQTVAKPRIAPAIGFKSNRPKSYLRAMEETMQMMFRNKGKWPLMVNDRMKRPYAMRAKKSPKDVNVAKEWDYDREGMVQRIREQLMREVERNLEACMLPNKDMETSLVVPLPGGGQAQSKDMTCILRLVEQDGIERHDDHVSNDKCPVYVLDKKRFGTLLGPSEAEEFAVLKHMTTAYLVAALEKYCNL